TSASLPTRIVELGLSGLELLAQTDLRHRGIRGIAAGVELVAVEPAVRVAVDADAPFRDLRHDGEGQLRARSREGFELRARQRVLAPVGLEEVAAGEVPAALEAAAPSLGHEPDRAGAGERHHLVEARVLVRARRAVERELLADRGVGDLARLAGRLEDRARRAEAQRVTPEAEQ